MIFAAGTLARAQDKQYLNAGDSDPEATQLLKDMEQYLEEMNSLSAAFTMTLDYPDSDPIEIKGSFEQQDGSYRITTEEYVVLCDGEIRWVHDLVSDEVSLYNANSDEFSTPVDYLRMYEKEEFAYRLMEEPETGLRAVEFKPLDRYSEYSKLRLTFKARQRYPGLIEVFEKGGGRIAISIDSLGEGKHKEPAWFKFDSAAHPDVHIEDLRID